MDIPEAGQGVAIEPRGHFIPVRKSDIARALLAEAKIAEDGDTDAWREFCRLIGAIFHFEYFAELERLKEAYYYFNPHHRGERPSELVMRAAYDDLVAALRHVLGRANFVEVTKAEIDLACRTGALYTFIASSSAAEACKVCRSEYSFQPP